jgi:glutamyl-tRNA synthetase
MKREEARARGLKPKYDGTCRDKGLGPSSGSVVRLKTPYSGTTLFNDLVKGPIRFENNELDDLVLRRSDGTPTYHMAVVADDISLGITHVIRGDDHVNNTPRQMLIYHALNKPTPSYAHVPMILGPDRTRLSKRHGAMSVLEYKKMGYLPEALINGLVRLGWSYGDQEKFTRKELIEKFSLESVGKAAGVFNSEKLLDLNAWYIRSSDDDKLVQYLQPLLEAMGFKDLEKTKVKQAAMTLKPRSKTLVNMAENGAFYFKEDISYEKKGDEKFLKKDNTALLEKILSRLEKMDDFNEKDLEKTFAAFLEENDIKLKKIAQPLRVALTGQTFSPGIFEVMVVLGKQEVLRRLEKAIFHVKNKVE